jgi:type I restriction enzyme S subunit
MHPKLRFKEYNENWQIHKLGEIADVKGGKRIPKGFSLQTENNGFAYITVSDMGNQTVSTSSIRYVPAEVTSKISNYKISAKDIFISVAGTLGIVGIIPPELDGANLTENANKLTNLKCNQKFLLHYLNSNKFKNLIESTKTVGAQPKLAIYAINSFEVCLPNSNEQHKIASFLNTVDEKIIQLAKKHELLTKYKKGLMQKIFSQELRFKADDGSDYPDWSSVKLAQISTRVKRRNTINDSNVLTISAQQGLINQQTYFTKSVSAKDITKYYLLNQGEFAYNKSYSKGYPMGAIKRLKNYSTGVVSTLYICFKLNENCDESFFEHYFECGLQNKELESVAQEGARNHGLLNIGLKQFFDINIYLPCFQEQKIIGAFINAIDSGIAVACQELDLLKKYKQGLLQKMFV